MTEHTVGFQGFCGDTYDSYDTESVTPYTYVTCGECENLVYADPDFYRPDEEIGALLTKVGIAPNANHWFARTMNAYRFSRLLRAVYPNGVPETAFEVDDDPNGV